MKFVIKIQRWFSLYLSPLGGVPEGLAWRKEGRSLGATMFIGLPREPREGNTQEGNPPRDLRKPPTPTSDALGNDHKD